MKNKRYIFGEWFDASSPLSVEDVERIFKRAEQNRKAMAEYPLDKVFTLFDRLRDKWNDETFAPRKKMLEELPRTTGFSREMIELAMKEVYWTLSPDLLKKKLHSELRGLAVQEWNASGENGAWMRWQPLGTILHVLSGNVFLVGIGSLVEGLITGNVNILKMSSNETNFLPIFLESLSEVDTDGVVSRSIATVDYSSSQKDVLEAFKKRVDGLVVWGGEEAVKAYRNDLPARTRVIVYGPKLSVAVITNDALRSWGPEKVADKLAYELAIWDQNACTAPQLCYVEGEATLDALLPSLREACTEWQRKLPSGPAEMNQAVEIQKLRSVAEIAEARGEGALLTSGKNVDWTITVSKDRTVEPSPLHRTLKLCAYDHTGEVLEELEKMRGYIQTIGLACGASEVVDFSRQILGAGALRVHELGQMSGGDIDDPHDGAYDLAQFGNFVYTRIPIAGLEQLHPIDLCTKEERRAIINARLRKLVAVAKHSSFYGERFKDVVIDTVDDLRKVPILTRSEMEAGMPPQKGPDSLSALQTSAEWHGGYVSKSGGSTGDPKYSVYDGTDWENMISEAVRVLKGAGLSAGDRIANCMLSGDLYGSFVSFDHINCRLGAATFAFAGHVSPENFLDIWKKFQFNVLEAMPTVLMPLVKVCKQQHKDFQLEKVIYAGSPLSSADREWLKTNLKTKVIASVIGANDGGQLAYQCRHLSGAFHHLIDDFNYVEILDEKNQPVPDGEAGRIVITSLLKFAFPLIRYDLGDSGRIVPKACPCGRTGRIIEYLGRSDDALCIGLMNLHYKDVIKSLKDLPLSVVQMVAQNGLEGEWVTFRIECEDRSEEFKNKIRALILESHPAIPKAIETKQILRFEVVLFKAGEIPRNPRTGKVRLVLDERV